MTDFERAFNGLGDNAAKRSDVLRIVQEDIMRILLERRRPTSLKILRDEIQVAHPLVAQALEELEKNRLIAIHDDAISLTQLGQKNAKEIYKRHLVIENYLAQTRSKTEAHTTAHILEHYVSGEVVNNVKKLATLKIAGVPLTEFELNRSGMITDIALSDYRLFERIVSMGIFLGERVTVTNKIPQSIVVKLKNKKFALDKNIAEAIKAAEYASSYEAP
jgi:Mn-dependent DtxR family transcriptional regulator/Fe2+ transport system protein FeoA